MHCPMRDSFCECLQKLSADTWDLLEDAKTVGTPIYEETITQVNSLELSKRFPYVNKVAQLTKPQETKLGADWIWVFYERKYWRSFRVVVQAKRLYEDSFYKAVTKNQTTKLINYAWLENAVPIYVFYNHEGIIKKAMKSASGMLRLLTLLQAPQGLRESLGAMACHASNINKLTAKNAKKPENVFGNMFPWWEPACRCSFKSSAVPPYEPIDGLAQGFQALRTEEERTPYVEPSRIEEILQDWLTSEDFNQEGLRQHFRPDLREGFSKKKPISKPSFIIATDVTDIDGKER